MLTEHGRTTTIHAPVLGRWLICAVRYALGRRSYIVSEICDDLELFWDHLSANARDVILRDIREELALAHRLGRDVGDAMDTRQWQATHDKLRAL